MYEGDLTDTDTTACAHRYSPQANWPRTLHMHHAEPTNQPSAATVVDRDGWAAGHVTDLLAVYIPVLSGSYMPTPLACTSEHHTSS